MPRILLIQHTGLLFKSGVPGEGEGVFFFEQNLSNNRHRSGSIACGEVGEGGGPSTTEAIGNKVRNKRPGVRWELPFLREGKRLNLAIY